MTGFMQLIKTTEKYTKELYLDGGMKWIDDHYDGAWSKAMDRFDLAVGEAIRSKDMTKAQLEARIYRATIEELLEAFKQSKRTKQVSSLFDRLEQGGATP